ncbi:MAG: DUF2478 domain-containing protein [Pseudomonadota bacterium]
MSGSSLLAAVVFDGLGEADAVLNAVSKTLRYEGVRLEGYVQHFSSSGDNSRSEMWLEDISRRESLKISQPLGPGARGCRLDIQALTEACGRMEQRLDKTTELLILNRFGKSEAEGRGLRSVIVRAMELDIPVLVAVRRNYFEAWKAFCGPDFVSLGLDKNIAHDWAIEAVKQLRAGQMVI